MSKRYLCLVVLFIIAVFLVGCGGAEDNGSADIDEATPSDEEVEIEHVTLRLGGLSPVGTPETDSAYFFAERLLELSDGKITVQVYPASQLGNAVSMIEQTIEGSIDFYFGEIAWYGNFIDDYSVLGMGFVISDYDHMRKFLDSEIHADMKDQLLGINLRMLSHVPRSPRVMFSKVVVNSPDDVNGLLMRVPEIPVYMKVWEALGANTTRISWAEIYLALQQGAVEACEGPIDASYDMKFHEVAPNVIMTNHVFSAYTLTMNEEQWESFPPQVQELVAQAGQEAVEYFWDLNLEYEQSILEKMAEEGANIVEVDVEPFRDILLDVAADFEEEGLWRTGLFEEIQALQ